MQEGFQIVSLRLMQGVLSAGAVLYKTLKYPIIAKVGTPVAAATVPVFVVSGVIESGVNAIQEFKAEHQGLQDRRDRYLQNNRPQ